MVSKGQEERKLEQAEASTRLLWQALKNPSNSGFEFERNVPMLPEYPTLDRKIMSISRNYRLSQIGGHKIRKRRSMKSYANSKAIVDDQSWRLSFADDQQYRHLFGHLKGPGNYFTLKKALTTWEKVISRSDSPRSCFGFGSSSQVVKLLSSYINGCAKAHRNNHILPNLAQCKEVLVDKTTDAVDNSIEFEQIPAIELISDDNEEEGDHITFYTSENDDQDVRHETEASNWGQNKARGKYLDDVFGERKLFTKNAIPQALQDIIFNSDSDEEEDNDIFEEEPPEEPKVREPLKKILYQSTASVKHVDDLNEEGRVSDLDSNKPKFKSQTKVKGGIFLYQSEELKIGASTLSHHLDQDTCQGDYGEIDYFVDDEREYLRYSDKVGTSAPCADEQNEVPVESTKSPEIEKTSNCPDPLFCFDLPSQDTSSTSDSESSSDSNLSFTIEVGEENGDNDTNNEKKPLNIEAENGAIHHHSMGNESTMRNKNLVPENRMISCRPIRTAREDDCESKPLTNGFSVRNNEKTVPLGLFSEQAISSKPSQHLQPSKNDDVVRCDKDFIDSQESTSIASESPFISKHKIRNRGAFVLSETQSVNSSKALALDSLALADTPDHASQTMSKEFLSDTPVAPKGKYSTGQNSWTKKSKEAADDLTDTPNSSGYKTSRNNVQKERIEKRLLAKATKEKNKSYLGCRFLDLEANDDSINSESDEESIEGLSQDSFINDSSQLGYTQGFSPSQGHLDLHNWQQIDADQFREDSFSTPIFNRRQRQTFSQNLPSSEKGIGKMHFIRSVIDHHRQGGDVNDIEKEYQSLLKNPSDSQKSK